MKKTNIIPSRRAVLTALLVSTILPSCSNIAGQGIVREKVSAFDGVKSINMSPSGVKVLNASITNLIAPNIGATWNSKNPKYVGLLLHHTSSTRISASPLYLNIQGLDINVNGKIHSFNSRTLTDHDSSRHYSSVSGIDTSSSNWNQNGKGSHA